ncbi:MAG: 4Fe-4S binding protein [candidate division NC10 bacterium]|nr:4Fe-4S binding protein [candidate division NC10 bacterium]
MRNLRRISQALFLLLFLFLAFATRYAGVDEIPYPVKAFLDFDPLLSLAILLAAHRLPATLLWSLTIVLMTALLGRVFCGWICPLGTLHHLIGSLGKKSAWRDQGDRLLRGQSWKYYLLIGLLISSLFSLQLIGFFDPLSLLIRSFAIFIDPALNLIAHSCLNALSQTGVPTLQTVAERLRAWGWETFLSFDVPHFHQASLMGLLLLGILFLNLVRTRFWCVALCPLGALLGLLSHFSLPRLKIADACNGCRICNRHCQTAATPYPADSWKGSECIYCWNCEDLCPEGAAHFQMLGQDRPAFGVNLERRMLLGSALGGALLVPLIRAGSFASLPSPHLIRPPGAMAEREFLRRCIRCGECMKVCPTHGLQPALLQGGWEGLWSPVLIPRLGYCEYSCTLCGQVCPTGAIQRLPLSEKQKVRIGLAFVDQGRCLPYHSGIPCIVCEEHCPTPKKAIWLQTGWVKDRQGRSKRVQLPRVDLQLCIGCGICEKRCPVLDLPAIRVSCIGESRSPQNQLLLSPAALVVPRSAEGRR